LTRTWPRAFRLALLDKDVAIAVGVLAEAGVAGPVVERVSSLLNRARATLGEAADYLDPIRLSEQQAGVELRG
jgi:3-hydroxyisobutyrate dehydrogenase